MTLLTEYEQIAGGPSFSLVWYFNALSFTGQGFSQVPLGGAKTLQVDLSIDFSGMKRR